MKRIYPYRNRMRDTWYFRRVFGYKDVAPSEMFTVDLLSVPVNKSKELVEYRLNSTETSE